MEETVPFGSREYWILAAALLFGRGMDFLSTWVATPNLILEANPIARKLGWKWGIPVNLALCGGFAFWPLAAIIITTTSLLVAARNFQGAWLMRHLGECQYSQQMAGHLKEVSLPVYLVCLLGQTAPVALVGVVLVFMSGFEVLPVGIGIGLVSYAGAVVFYSLLSLWRIRRAPRYSSAEDYVQTDTR
jgi:hypothetical protein